MGIASTRLLVYAGIVGAGVGAAFMVLGGPPKLKPGMRLFLIGDSLAVGLTKPLSALATEHKIAFKSMAEVGTRIDQWAQNDKMFQAVREFKPDLILVSLGTNDEFMKLDAKERQAPHLDKLLKNLREVAPVAWIGPPKLPTSGTYTWKGTNGAIPLIQERVPSNMYFPSQTLEIPRAPDKLHPSVAGAALWAGKIWSWIT